MSRYCWRSLAGISMRYTWITHRMLANAQTANMLFLWIHAMAGEWAKALHYVPSLAAFVVGVVMACVASPPCRRQRRADQLPDRNRLSRSRRHSAQPACPILQERLAFPWSRRCRPRASPRVEAWTYSSVMATANLRQTIEGAFSLVAGDRQIGLLRTSSMLHGRLRCIRGRVRPRGAYVTVRMPALTLGIPVTVLLIALLRCEHHAPGRDGRATLNRGHREVGHRASLRLARPRRDLNAG